MKQNRRSSVFIRQQEDSVDGLLNDRRVKTDDSGSSNSDGDDAGAGLSWSEVGVDAFPHGEAVALIAAETNRGRCAVLLEPVS